ncbi:MAG: translesion error-prone DNA polymerase V autoproteolytic subunit [Bacteroidales bacterium]|jgi:DNA polymerase V|nr:translesion error-prone DNA polymerase V autoproteolytic subunit [Bacteroidales bacterium]
MNQVNIHIPDTRTTVELPFAATAIPAGFPSPADDYLEPSLDLNKKLIKNPGATFFAQVVGSSMQNAGIHDGDIVVIDKSLPPQNNSILVCSIDGEFTLKRFKKADDQTGYLMPDNPAYDPIKVTRDNQLIIWGVVTYTIHKH